LETTKAALSTGHASHAKEIIPTSAQSIELAYL
jgi:hypothetical protein